MCISNLLLAFVDWHSARQRERVAIDFGIASETMNYIAHFMKGFRTLHVWEKAHQFVLEFYLVRRKFPENECFGLVSQLRRAFVSIPSNIAEGRGRSGDSELRRFMQIAMGSASEVEYQIQLAKDSNYLAPDKYTDLNSKLLDLKKMLNAFLKKLK